MLRRVLIDHSIITECFIYSLPQPPPPTTTTQQQQQHTYTHTHTHTLLRLFLLLCDTTHTMHRWSTWSSNHCSSLCFWLWRRATVSQSLSHEMSSGHILVQTVVRIMPGFKQVGKLKSKHNATPYQYPASLTPYWCAHDLPNLYIISSISLAHTSIAFSPNHSFHLISALSSSRCTLTFEHNRHKIILSYKSLQRRSWPLCL